MQQYLQNKKGLVQGVFDQVFDKYDFIILVNYIFTYNLRRESLFHSFFIMM